MDLMEDVRAHYALKLYGLLDLFDNQTLMQNSPSRAVVQESAAPITYVTLTAEHLPQVHDILHRSFWSGIDSSCLLLKDGCLSDEITYLS